MTTQIYHFKDYRLYLKAIFSNKEQGYGNQTSLANYLRCQTSFISQVLTGRSDFSLEHAYKVAQFLSLTALETRFFITLLQKQRSGTAGLREYFSDQLRDILDAREEIKAHIQVEAEINLEDQAQYYSSWMYAAIHILAALPQYNTLQAICRKLSLSTEVVARTLKFLEERSLVSQLKGGSYKIGLGRVHLGKGSPFIQQHHINWRNRAIAAIDKTIKEDLHFSSVIGISVQDSEKIKEILTDSISRSEVILKNSQEQEAYVMLVDFFKL